MLTVIKVHLLVCSVIFVADMHHNITDHLHVSLPVSQILRSYSLENKNYVKLQLCHFVKYRPQPGFEQVSRFNKSVLLTIIPLTL
ncbi:hypothetical protein EG68_05104 [Paragonimus skrjabini miyazakii]|uniref:Secreted protein n=1 Tax=Paragonimus skrjabini miyazakii TaxID=59628 RepID=A0A8S9Z3P9_9TREM|nr:hypothetical protein EG68_05104 [Paragonimus skrjabini miyazakii]